MHDLASLETLSRDLPQTKRGHERCVSLLESATELFLEHGYDAVSLDDIVNHAGGSKASIYKYFGNKEGLFKSICDYRRNEFFKDIFLQIQHDEIKDFREYLISTMVNFLMHLNEPANAAFLRLILEQSQRNADIARHIHECGPEQVQCAISKYLQSAHNAGYLHCENPAFSAQFYFGILRNIEWRILMGLPLEESVQENINYITYCVDRFLDAHQKP